MSLTVSALPVVDKHQIGLKVPGSCVVPFQITFDDSYLNGGEALTPANLGLSEIYAIAFSPIDDYVPVWDRANAKVKLLLLQTPIHTGTVKDDDSATSNGTDVKVAPEGTGSVLAFLNSVNANNADALWQIGSGGPNAIVDDNDTPAGVVLYFDEDATDPARRFLAVVANAHDQLILLSDGTYLLVAHDASAASNGVAVHFDDNGATVYERLLFVSPTNADGSFHTYGEVPATTDCSAVVLRGVAYGI